VFKTILVPLDRSSLAEQALGTAAAIAQASHGKMSLVLAHPMAPFDGGMAGSWSDAKDPEDALYLRRVADEIARGASISVDSTVATGAPAEAICRRARDIGADLIVMTSHGRTGFSRAWLGSVADAVVRHARVPVLMLRAASDTAAIGHGQTIPLFRRILVPLDGSVASSSILPAAAAMARYNDAHLILLRVVTPALTYVMDPQIPSYPTTVINWDATQHEVDETQGQLSALATSLEHEHSIKIETVVEASGASAQTILGVAGQRGADLIAMTTRGRGASRLVVGSVTDKVLRGGATPMLLYRPGEESSPKEVDAPS